MRAQVVELTERLCGLGDEIAGYELTWLTADEAAHVMASTERVRRALGALDATLTGLVASSEPVARDRLRLHLGVSRADAARRARVADTVAVLPAVGAAYGAGVVSDGHVEAIGAARKIAASGLDAHIPMLLQQAAQLGVDDFAKTAADTARRVAVDSGESHHRHLRKRRSLRWWRTTDGMTRLSGDLDPDSASIIVGRVEQQLHRTWHSANPTGHQTDAGDSVDARRLDALTAICTTASDASADTAPVRVPVTVGVIVDYDTLVGGLHEHSVCRYDTTGDPIPPSVARTLACDAGVYPAVLDARSEVLDLGRETRTPSRAIRRALNVRDNGCVHPACNAPPAWCDAHHVVEWWSKRHGPTHIDNLVSLCRHHHTQLHQGAWQLPDHLLARAETCHQQHPPQQHPRREQQTRQEARPRARAPAA